MQSDSQQRASKRRYLGLDLSTQSLKLVVLDYGSSPKAASHPVIYQDSLNFDRDFAQYQTHGGYITSNADSREQDPLMWREALHQILTRLKTRFGDVSSIASIGVSGQQHSLVCLGEAGMLTRPLARLWCDTSTTAEASELNKALGGRDACATELGSPQKAAYTASKILSFRKENIEAFGRTRVFLLPHNYINWLLTGGEHGGVLVMEAGDASGMGLMSLSTKQWSSATCQVIDSRLLAKLPPIRSSREAIGYVHSSLCRDYGFAPDCVIAPGSGDNMCAAIGSGNVEPGCLTLSLGTSGTAYSVSNQASPSYDGAREAFCDGLGRYLNLVCINNMDGVYAEFCRNWNLSHADFDQLACEVQTSRAVLMPWFHAERSPQLPAGSAAWLGLSNLDFVSQAGKATLARSLLEGLVLNLYAAHLKLDSCQESQAPIRLTGGLARSKVWQQAVSDIFARPVLAIDGELAALGAALQGKWILDACPPPSLWIGDHIPWCQRSSPVSSETSLRETFRAKRRNYLALSSCLEQVMNKKN